MRRDPLSCHRRGTVLVENIRGTGANENCLIENRNLVASIYKLIIYVARFSPVKEYRCSRNIHK